MIFKQFYLGCLAHASYLIGDEEAKTAAVVDPQRDVNQYLDDAQRLGLNIKHVFLSHFHADFIAGHLELRDRVGASIYIGARGSAEYKHVPMNDGDTLGFGTVRLQVLETPGHSPESICILVFDLSKDAGKPYAVLTGDTLFIGDVGRPDLRASLGWSAEELGRMLYSSIHDKLLTLPDETKLYPAHGAGSLCGKNMSKDTVSTIGIQRAYNYAVQAMTEDEFVRMVTTDQPDAPDYFMYDAILNTKERPTLEKTLERELTPLALDDLLRLKDEGAQILDVRDPADFEGAHLKESVSIGLGGQYATWAGTLLDRHKPIVILADIGREEEAALRLGRIGFDHIAGYLQGGLQALDQRPDLLRRTERITAATLAEHLGSPQPPTLIDVRTEQEWKRKRIEGSINIPLSQFQKRMNEIPRNRTLVVHCASGYRSAMALSLLEIERITNTMELVGGVGAWEAAKLHLEIATV